jgi:U3 small nucleolar RNA-associated protein 19
MDSLYSSTLTTCKSGTSVLFLLLLGITLISIQSCTSYSNPTFFMWNTGIWNCNWSYWQTSRTRFFMLASIFLSSTHLPAYLVAAFAKRLARLSLQAPPSGCIASLVFIYNLLQRHSSCRVLIHREPKGDNSQWNETTSDNFQELPKQVLLIGASSLEEDSTKSLSECDGFDPYLHQELDPSKCNAMNSSLWEIQVSLIAMHRCNVSKDPGTTLFPWEHSAKSIPKWKYFQAGWLGARLY